MSFASGLFFLLWCSLIGLFLIMLIRPRWVRMYNRKQGVLIYGTSIVVGFIAWFLPVRFIAWLLPTPPKSPKHMGEGKLALVNTQRSLHDVNLEPARQKIAVYIPPPYRVVERKDQSIANRKRLAVYMVAPEAKTVEHRGALVIAVAQKLQKESGAKIVMVFLIPSGKKVGGELVFAGTNLALARYAPDGGGYSGDQGWKWEVQAYDGTVDPQEIKIAERWYELKSKYQIDDGFGGTRTDEDALSAALAAEFGVSVDDVGLPCFDLKDYPLLGYQ